MDLASTFQSIAARGAMFWAASGSVALGGTLILIAVVAQLKRLRGRKASRMPAAPKSQVARKRMPSEMVAATETSLGAETQSPNTVQAPELARISDPVELMDLTARLRSAADKLENFRRLPDTPALSPQESPLKESSSAVDYVFRAEMG